MQEEDTLIYAAQMCELLRAGPHKLADKNLNIGLTILDQTLDIADQYCT